MRVNKILENSYKKLRDRKIKSASLDTEVLLSYVLKKTRSYLYIWPDKKITKNQATRYKRLIKKRCDHEPVAYLIHHKEFFGLDFYINKNVLIPRPATETLVDIIIKLVDAGRDPHLRILDVGTGSGCMAVTLKKYLPKTRILASDLSEKILKIAKKNAKKNKVKINFRKGNLLEPWKNFKLDIIVANLPYLTPQQMKAKSIQAEPQKALYGGKKGLEIYEELFRQIKDFKIKAKVFIEIDPRQIKNITKLIKEYFPKRKIAVIQDLSGQDRVVVIK
ncbi:MAG: peptide chain release factor N(5)-glutamine methyltransferase [Patescibacteria group bacterium]|nr:peptide chain release factor N(5)-glutamine methyltransferase [Patescibacteria group bacterium]